MHPSTKQITKSFILFLILGLGISLACSISPSLVTPQAVRTKRPSATLPPAEQSTLSQTGEWIEKDGYGIQLLAAVKTSSPVFKPGSTVSISPDEGKIFIKMTFELSVEGQILGFKDLNENRVAPDVKKLILVDSNARAYPIFEDPGISIILKEDGTFGNDFVVFFSVPIDSQGFKLQYRDLPQIDLGL